MDIGQYIESGVLEAYVLGNLPDEELKEVEQLLGEHDVLREELLKIQLTLEALSQRVAIMPEGMVKRQLMEKLRRLHQNSALKEAATPEWVKPVSWRKYWVAASIWLLVTFSFSFYFYHRWREVQNELDRALSQKETTASQYELLREEYEAAKHYLNIIHNPEFKQVKLTMTTAASGGNATVYWNESNGEVYLDIADLPAPDTARQYQLWAIKSGEPVNAGLVERVVKNRLELIKMERVNQASAFAITLEPAGGSNKPTLEALFATGEV